MNLVRMNLIIFVASPEETQPTRTYQTASVRRPQGTSIVPCNIEGVRHNAAYFQNLCKVYEIVCLQEHWMWECQKHELDNLALDKDSFSRCSDHYAPLTGFSLPRGRGGVSVLWPTILSSKVKKINEEMNGSLQLNFLDNSNCASSMCISLQTIRQ